MGEMIQLTASDGQTLSAYRADPEGTARAGVVVIQEVFGVNSHIREVADGYAAAGYLAVAPAVYDRVQAGVELGYTQDDINEGVRLRGEVPLDAAMADIRAAAEVARTAGSGKVGTVGYCWGGFLSAAAAINLPGVVDACVGYYGGGIAAGLLDQEPQVPLLLHFGEQDHAIPPEDVEKVKAAWPRVPTYVYAGAQHGFECDQRATYQAHAARMALSRTLRFFFERLG
jgi:carboxymethylenebutenolidase